jgi:hypothetical protein
MTHASSAQTGLFFSTMIGTLGQDFIDTYGVTKSGQCPRSPHLWLAPDVRPPSAVRLNAQRSASSPARKPLATSSASLSQTS